MNSFFQSNAFTFSLIFIFLIIIFLLPAKKYELFTLGLWKNNFNSPPLQNGYCAPDFSKFSKNDNVAVRCVGNGNMTYADCCKLRNMGQVCGVNLDNWESYDCKYYPGKACERCKTQNAQY